MKALSVPYIHVPYGKLMPISRPREALFLFLGDIFFLALALIVTLIVRYAEVPDARLLTLHFVPFSFLFLLSTLVFFIAGLYEKHTLTMKEALPATVFYAQCANIIIAVALFFFAPFFAIQPKAFLFLYLFFSTILVSVWRTTVFPALSVREPAPAILLGSGTECEEVYEEVNGNTRYSVRFEAFHRTQGEAPAPDDLLKLASAHSPSVVVMPASYLRDPAFASAWSTLARQGVRFISLSDLYEELFERVALPLIDGRVFFEKGIFDQTFLYATLKRVMDVALSTSALILISPLLLAVWFALKAGGGNALIFQERIGQGNRLIRIIKFRTMLFDDAGDPEKQKKNRVTAFGAFLRKWQIDEMPQFLNVIMGDLSLVGPRPEIPALVAEYEKHIPYYGARHMIQPGISGWAQIKHASPPKWKLDVEATRNKLSFDLYYLKHRSIVTDTVVALRTLKILAARAGK